MFLSIVSPIYKGELMLNELVERIKKSVTSITNDYEIILVNDCSPDASWDKIKTICYANPNVKGINLSRNFGQHYAITAGLSVSSGEWVVVIDCDLQDRPEEIPALYKKCLEGFEVVLAQRIDRQDGFFKKLSSTLFYQVFAYLTDSSHDKTVANFGIYKRNVINAVLSMGDAVRSFPNEVNWVGFKQAKIPVVHAARAEGKSSYNLRRLISFAVDNMLSFSNKPLRLMVEFGFYITLLAFFIAIYYFFSYINGSIEVSGFTTLVISLWLIGGILIMLLGMIGIYLGKTFDQVKGRPSFIIKDKLNFNE